MVLRVPYEYRFFILSKILQYKFPKKQANNIVSGTHAFGATCLSLLSKTNIVDISLLKNFSSGYFLYDTLQLINKDRQSLMDIGYIYHHLASIYLLNSTVDHALLRNIFFWAELSNLPTYPLYHYIHQKGNHENKIKKLHQLQKIVFTSIRLIVISRLIHQYFKKRGVESIPKPLLAVLPIYFMGLKWTYKILAQ